MTFLQPPPQIPQSQKAAYGNLAGTAIDLRMRFVLLQQLFASSPQRLLVLNRAAQFFFSTVQDMLLDDLILGLCRISDPPKTQNKNNLTLKRLLSEVSSTEVALAQQLNDLHTDLDKKIAIIRTHRHKRVAHADLATALATLATPAELLPPITVAAMREAIEAVETYLQAFHRHYTHATIAWDQMTVIGDGEDLLRRLCMADAYIDFEKQGIIPKGKWREYYRRIL